MNPKVSILVPVYGAEKYIERCAHSLFEQTYPDIEYIFVDDCSPDSSIDVLMQVLEGYPQRKNHVHIIRHDKNRGLAAARNTAVDVCQTEFLMHVDSDDWIEKSTIEKLLKKQAEADADIVCFDIKVAFQNYIDYYKNTDYADGKDLTIKMLLGKSPHQVWGHLIRRNLYVDNEIKVLEGINQSEDFQVMPRIAYYAKKVATLREVLYNYDRTREDSYTNNFTIKSELQIRETYKILSDFFENKSEEYNEALNVSEVNSLVGRMKNLSQIAEAEGLYDSLSNRLSIIGKKYWKGIKSYNRPILYIRNKTFVKYYSQFIAWCGKFIKNKI